MPVASFHLTRYPRATAHEGLSRMGLDRPLLRRTPGLRFWRLLGTGRGRTMTLGADLRRWAMFAVWEEEAALDAFLADSPVAARWRELGRGDLHRAPRAAALARRVGRATRCARRRRAAEPRDAAPVAPHGARARRPVAILTRASIRPLRLARFYRAIAAARRASCSASPGLLASVGVGRVAGRAPGDLLALALARGRHRATPTARPATARWSRRTRAERWYAEELFARFRAYGSAGTWDGEDPLAAG